jgi:ubiquinone/menaquinone biosynthesis C-methylase UbiE
MDPLYDDPSLAEFYDYENAWGASVEYCRCLASSCASVLDLGCGTGLLAVAMAEHGRREVVGVDPALPMLEIARRRDGAKHVHWIGADARSLRLDRRFELITLTGHAFQVFLTPEDQAAVLRTIAHHLTPAGRFIFDTRNPIVEEWREWTPDRSAREFEHPTLGMVRAWNDVAHDPASGIVTYSTFYRGAGNVQYSARSRIAFPARDQVSLMIESAGLAVERWFGDWSEAPWTASSPEIIPFGRPG